MNSITPAGTNAVYLRNVGAERQPSRVSADSHQLNSNEKTRVADQLSLDKQVEKHATEAAIYRMSMEKMREAHAMLEVPQTQLGDDGSIALAG